jgi:UDP-glucuronate 4-epimerase
MVDFLITGTAGFIGSSLTSKLLKLNKKVVGIDNHNNYYDPKLKNDRLSIFKNNKNYHHSRFDISNLKKLEIVFKKYKPKIVINLAAQAGVRYSIENPHSYIKSNIVGFSNILECCRHNKVKHLIYASTSSVYGANTKTPFSIHDNTNHPLSLYAASKKSNELMAHTYSSLYKLPTTGLRFFTVYGPWGRPDMALFKFTKSILNNQKIEVYNNGNHTRDFTYIDDIVEGIINVTKKKANKNDKWNGNNPDPGTSNCPWRIYNIGNNNPTNLMKYINVLEKTIGKKAKIRFLPLQRGDVESTYADVSDLEKKFNYKPSTKIETGISNFVNWYKDFYKIKF